MEEYSGSGGGIMSIPALRKAFENIQEKAIELSSKSIDTGSIKEFTHIWAKEFGKPITDESAKTYLEHIKEMGLSKKRTIKGATRKQRGGEQRGGAAPLDHQTAPGIYGTYGNFLPYVAGGFEVGVPRISQLEGWGRVDTTPQVPRDIGEGALNPLKGGGKRGNGKRNKTRRLKPRSGNRRQKGGDRILLSTNPTTVVADGVSYWKGQSLPPSPSPLDHGPRLIL